jgi:glucose/arabinose dehydrogenase
MITGLKYGSSANVGRESTAVAAGLWPSTSAFVPLPSAGESLQPTAFDTTDPNNWGSATPDFDSFFGTGSEILDPLPAIPKGTVTIELQTVVDNLIAPLGLTSPDDGTDRQFVHDQRGTVTVIENGTPLGTPFMDVGSRLVPDRPGFDERGLLGLAFHPNFAANPMVYTYTSEPVSSAATADFTNTAAPASQDHQTVISEWTLTGGVSSSNTVDLSTRREILRIDQPQFNHDGGAVRFGPDGFLYISLGDGGQSDDQGDGHVAGGNAQDNTNIYGSILRIDVDQAVGTPSANGQYNIPPGNPFAGGGDPGLDEIYAHGFRNPFAFSFDQGLFDTVNFQIFVGDAGQNDIEEVDRITSAEVGGNFGWRFKEGSFFFDPQDESTPGFVTSIPPAPVPAGLVDPFVEYDQDDGNPTQPVENGIAVIGGFVYRGTAIPELDGRYVFGDFSTSFGSPLGRLWYVDAGNQILELMIGEADLPLGLFVKGFGQDSDGEVYVCASTELAPVGSTGVVLKLTPVTITATEAGEIYR